MGKRFLGFPLPVNPPVRGRAPAKPLQAAEADTPTNAYGSPSPVGSSELAYPDTPGNVATAVFHDEWLGITLRNVPHDGIETGRQLFVGVPGPPPEGHEGYDIPAPASVIHQSTQHQALFWSDWYGSTAANAGGGGSFRGEHVVILRVPPGSTQGYMPTGMEQPNNARNAPSPWDQNLILGQLAAVSQ